MDDGTRHHMSGRAIRRRRLALAHGVVQGRPTTQPSLESVVSWKVQLGAHWMQSRSPSKGKMLVKRLQIGEEHVVIVLAALQWVHALMPMCVAYVSVWNCPSYAELPA